MKKRKKMLIIDTFALIFRAFYAFINNPLKTSKGEPTAAIFGFVRMLIKLLKNEKPDYLVLALDSPKKTFRHVIYTEYKANRTDPPDDLKVQIPLIIELINKFNLASLQKDGYEADDIIGTLCEKYKNEDIDTYVVTGDKDMLQLVEGNIKVLSTVKGITEVVKYDREKVKERWGVYPDKLVDLFALMGDSSDNIPGVKGVGPKTALELITSYSSVENIYRNIDTISKMKLREKLLNDEVNAVLSKKLVTINREVPLKYHLDDFININIAQEEAITFLKKYELHSILKDKIFSDFNLTDQPIESNSINNVKNTPKGHYKMILTKADFQKLIEEITKAKLLSIDLETTSADSMMAMPIGIAFSTKTESGYFLPLKNDIIQDDTMEEGLFEFQLDQTTWKADLDNYELDEKTIYHELKRICEDSSIQKIGQNLKYDSMIFKRTWDIEIKPISFDVMIASYLLDPGRKSHSMDHLAVEFLNYETIHYKDIVEKTKTLLDVDLHTVTRYAAEDADITLRLYHKLKPLIDKSSFNGLYYDVELPLVSVLQRMEHCGVEVDVNHLKKMSSEIGERLTKLEKEIWELSGSEFNINSTKQLSEILFNKLGLATKKKTKSGYSTDVSVLEELAVEHQVPLYLLEYRKLKKLKSGYLDSIPKLINPNTGKVHTSFNQTITQTGRLSSNKPNLQNIPIKEEVGRAIRKGFVASKGNYIMSADYSQIELRILAHMSSDTKLIKAYLEDRDIHTQTASLIFSKPEQDITTDERRIAKTINFSVIYGIGAFALAKDLKISTKQAKEFIENYFKEYVGVKKYIEQQKKIAYEQGFVETLFHRIRYLPEIQSNNKRDISFGERLAVNTPIQGTSADLIKIAMVQIDKEIRDNKLESFMTIQVHDELVFEVPENELEIMKLLVVKKMESAAQLSVPLRVTLSYGKNWEEAH